MTLFSDIYELFLTAIQDYKIDAIAEYKTNFENYLQGFLILAIPEFDNCVQDLTNYNLTSKTFNITLTLEEKKILSDWMIYVWFNREVNNVTQFNLHLNDTDFKRSAEASNLKSKIEYSNCLREIYTQRKVDYGIKQIDWTSWVAGNFDP